MIENVLHPRIIENKDWATLLFVVSFIIIAATKSVFENQFGDFMKLIYSTKHNKTYKDGSQLMSGFTLSLFVVQIISLTFFIQLIMSYFGYVSKIDWVAYIQIATFLTFFILSKFLLEKIIGTAFKIEEFIEQFNLQKVRYRTYIGLFILPIDIILFYYDIISKNVILFLLYIVLTISVLIYLSSIKKYQKIIFSKLFYFILYLCTLEIAPYYFMYYLFTKGSV